MSNADDCDGNIPPEIIADILRRLPPKSIGRFRCVSKPWRSLLSHSQFVKTHHLKSQNPHHLLFDSNGRFLYSLQIQNPFHQPVLTPTDLRFRSHHNFKVLGSCNGLVLVSARDVKSPRALFILNPTTREFVEVPEPQDEMFHDLLEIEFMYGFGHDSLADDYKVVIISYFHNNYLMPCDRMFVHVYSLKTNTWRWLADSPFDHSHGRITRGVFVNGFLHWLAKKASAHFSVVVAFSLAEEKFSEVPLPIGCVDVDITSMNNCKLVVLGEKLGMFCNNNGVGEVLVMNEYGVQESWTLISIHGFERTPILETMFLLDRGKILLVGGNLLSVYDVEKQTWFHSVAVAEDLVKLKVRDSYVESLVSPALIRANEIE